MGKIKSIERKKLRADSLMFKGAIAYQNIIFDKHLTENIIAIDGDRVQVRELISAPVSRPGDFKVTMPFNGQVVPLFDLWYQYPGAINYLTICYSISANVITSGCENNFLRISNEFKPKFNNCIDAAMNKFINAQQDEI